MPRVTAAEAIHAVVVWAAKAKAFMPAEPMTVPRICRPRPAGDLLAQLLAQGGELRGLEPMARNFSLPQLLNPPSTVTAVGCAARVTRG
jgi:hypothetical protein